MGCRNYCALVPGVGAGNRGVAGETVGGDEEGERERERDEVERGFKTKFQKKTKWRPDLVSKKGKRM